MNLPSPMYILVTDYGRKREWSPTDIEMTRDGLVADIASGEIIVLPVCIFEWHRGEGEPRNVTADIAKEVSVHLWANEHGCKGDLRDWIDENCGASEADKINARAGVLEPV